ncbi:unnamed protein product [Prorocentrum cordatum]|uniref:Uncharacterized protein n=1 Tax=Prorocentrum cordatum TaxID=2364126 RepID=A0ABN9T4I2_9DINO|nr:unnamed protein product [Polarella glacialis]|mmetsp:Transcript_82552/g.215469  ORF Transcript_82552/g.215469 Transcript_82552/m.215469 type:complete len:270 (-) Transcript_82552:123-932(-)
MVPMFLLVSSTIVAHCAGVTLLAAQEEVKMVEHPMYPHMGVLDRARLYMFLANATNYREFGSGGSTVQAATRFKNIQKIVVSESDNKFVHYLLGRSDLRREAASGRLVLRHADVGPVRGWGFPKDRSHVKQWPAYSSYNNSMAEFDPPFWFDMVFVDGRFRVACLLKALKATPSDRVDQTVFAVHDYKSRAYRTTEEMEESSQTISFFANRFVIRPENIPQKWHDESRKGVVEDNLNEEDNTLALFRKKKDFDESKLDAAIAKYELQFD